LERISKVSGQSVLNLFYKYLIDPYSCIKLSVDYFNNLQNFWRDKLPSGPHILPLLIFLKEYHRFKKMWHFCVQVQWDVAVQCVSWAQRAQTTFLAIYFFLSFFYFTAMAAYIDTKYPLIFFTMYNRQFLLFWHKRK
jgi:hypothetical protein